MNVIRAEYIDAFITLRGNVPHTTCDYRGCRRAGKIRVLWRQNERENQSHAYVCVNHGFDLANEVLGKYKFNQW